MRSAAALLATLALFGAGAARAQTAWPDRPITFVVSNGAGSSPDVMARLVASRLDKILGQSVIVENRAGAANVIGAMSVARAAPDGSRFYFATSSALSSNVVLVKNLPYDPQKDFDPIALVVQSPQLLVVHKDVPARSLQALVALDKKSPGALSIATDGPRNATGITAGAFNMRAGTRLTPVAYPNIMNGLQDAMAGRMQVGVFPPSILVGAMQEGTLIPIGVTSQARLAAFPDVPPIADLLPGFDFSGWFMLVAPHGTPQPIVAKMNAALDAAMRDPDIRTLAPKLGYAIDPKGVGSPADAARFMTDQIALWRRIAAELRLEAE